MSVNISDLSFSYGERSIFSHLSLTFPDAGFIIILGKSGSGKSTFLSLLSGTSSPDEGKIEGNSLTSSSFVFQSSLLLDYLSVRENVMLPLLLMGSEKKKSQAIADECLEKTDMSSFKDRFPPSLSGGEQVRVSISRALAKGSSMIILDEPTGMLDEKNSRAVFELLKKLSEDHLVVLVTHDEKNAIDLADYLYELKDGKMNLLHLNKRDPGLFPKTSSVSKGKLSIKDSIKLADRFLSKKKARVIISSIFIGFTMCLFYLSMNLRRQLPTAIDELLSDYYSYQETSITVKETVADNGKLALEKYRIPDETVLQNLGIKKTYVPLDYFLPSSGEVMIGEERTSVSFAPVIFQSSDMIEEGSVITKAMDVVVNHSFLSEMKLDSDTALGKAFSLSHQSVIYSDQFTSRELVSFDFEFRICGVSKEKNAFNSSAIYYSYPLMRSKIGQTYLPSISEEEDKETRIEDLLTEKYHDEDFCSQKLIFLSSDPESVKEKAEEIYDNVSITSNVLSIKESTTDMISSLTDVAMVFLVLVLLSAILLEFLIVYSLYEDNLRLFALAKVFSSSTGNGRISVGIQCVLLLLVMIVLLLFSLLFSSVIDFVLAQYDLPAFLSAFDGKAFFLSSLITFLCSFISSRLPLHRISDKEIRKELEGED